ncbi:MAG: gliding motility-associated C-terminal domain-containing protein [Spirochaetales bacterium]|nr:gliding motility-associated C-terminal domain-containing protein [Spirochaetales bacterium]
MKKALPIILVLLFIPVILSALPGSAGELEYNLASPLLLSQGFNLFNRETPQAITVNPAAAAGFQRYIIDINYINLEQFNDSAGVYGGMGHSLNMALSVPMKIGVLTSAVHLTDTSSYGDTSLNFGTSAGADVAFSKELYEDVHFGFGLNGTYGFAGEWGLAASFGLTFMYGDLGFLKDTELSAVFSRVGLGYAPDSRGFWASVPENVTPAVGISSLLLDQGNLKIRGRGVVSLPAFSDLKLDAGADIAIGERVNLSTSLSADIQDLVNGDWQTIIPAVGLNVIIPLTPDSESSRLSSTEMRVNGGGRALYDGVYAFGAGVTMPLGVRDKDAPEVNVTYNKDDYKVSWISPNYDGIQDELTVPFTVTDGRYIEGYKISVRDSSGNTVKEIYNKDERPENATFSNFFDRLFAEKQSVAIPDTFRWDGVSDSGETPPDGEYSFVFQFWDDNNNMTTTAPAYFNIDNKAPELALEPPTGTDLIFSPDGDGRKDKLTIPQSGSSEEDWVGEIRDSSGTVYRTFNWNGEEPKELVWDGTDSEGEVLPDGVYEYDISATDRAGNSISQSVGNILINTTQPELALTINRAWFSPGTESEISDVEIGFKISTVKGLAQWSLDIIDDSGKVYRSWNQRNSQDLLTKTGLTFDGKDSTGIYLKEGAYKARLDASYQNGFSPVVYTPPFTVDTTNPRIRVSAAPLLFSPDGDGNRDEIVFTQNSSEEKVWNGYILDDKGVKVKSYEWHGSVPSTFNWNGMYENGKSVTGEASFTYYVETRDNAGNYGRSEDIAFTADTSNVELFLTLDRESISPNKDGINETINIGVERNNNSPVSSYRLTALNGDGQELALVSEGKGLPSSFRWDGGSVMDGTCHLFLAAKLERGDTIQASSPEFLIDRIYPEISLDHDISLFSPDGDGNKDVIKFVQTSSAEELFQGEMLDRSGNVVASWVWKDRLADFNWEGKDDSGNILPNGVYTYRVLSTDKAGNRTEKKVDGLTVDNRQTQLFLTADKEIFSPSGRVETSVQNLALVTTLKEGISSWNLDLVHETKGTVFTLQGDGTKLPPENFVWDGKGTDGTITEGSYTAKYRVLYNKGNRPEAETAPFILDNSAPETRVVMNPQPFSPDEDNVDDELTITMGVQDISAVDSWKMEILDPKGKEFISYGGKGKPTGRIIWDGRSSKGELVQSAEDYTWNLTVTDVMGNSSYKAGTIPVDVLVIRDGENLKIMISSITFEPNQAGLETTGDKGSKNVWILGRVGEILKKYNRYQVVVEGHANSVYYYNPARAKQEETEELQPLSESRAKTVMDALIDLGIDKNRLDFQGKGGTAPVVPFSDTENSWKNRRVEFILKK